MKVLLINPSGGYKHEYPPLGLLYIAAVLKKSGHEVLFFDEGVEFKKKNNLLDYIGHFKPAACGIALYTTNLYEAFKTIGNIKKKYPDCVIFVGGPHATVLPEKTLSECPAIDFLICGEGENTTVELLDKISNGNTISGVNGLYYREGGNIKNTPPRLLIDNLDTIPFPSYELTRGLNYRFDTIRAGRKVATIMTSRGCPYECVFCAAKAVWKKSFRRRSPENVVKEIAWLTQEYGYDELYFMDDLFAINSKWLDEFYLLMREYNIRLPWKCLGRVDSLSYSDYERMGKNGCYVIQFGVESGDNRILCDIKKKINTSEVRRAFSEARSAGLNTYGFFIFGHRLDTYQTVIKTVNFAKSLSPDFVSFFCMVPFPGTEVYDLVPQNLRFNWRKFAYSAWGRGLVQIKTSSVEPDDLLKFERQAYAVVYASFSYLLKNIILSCARVRLFRRKIFLFGVYCLYFISLILSGRWIFAKFRKLDFTDCAEPESFDYIWESYFNDKDLRKHIAFHLEHRKRFLDILIKQIKLLHPKNIIEVGCGTAIDSHYLAGLFKETNFSAIDVSTSAVAVAGRIGRMLDSRVDISLGDMGAMKFDDCSFDIVFSQGVMEHFKDPLPYIKKQLRILKPKGLLVISVPQKFNPYTIYKHRRLKEGVWEYGWETEYSFGDLKELGSKFDLEISQAGGCGYAYFQDYGFSILPFILRWFKKEKIPIFSFVGNFLLKIIEALENKYGHYFMQDIVMVYKKK